MSIWTKHQKAYNGAIDFKHWVEAKIHDPVKIRLTKDFLIRQYMFSRNLLISEEIIDINGVWTFIIMEKWKFALKENLSTFCNLIYWDKSCILISSEFLQKACLQCVRPIWLGPIWVGQLQGFVKMAVLILNWIFRFSHTMK